MLNLPNALTLSRIFVVPLLVVVLLTPLSENWLGVQRHFIGVALFLAAAFTDYLDGHIALDGYDSHPGIKAPISV